MLRAFLILSRFLSDPERHDERAFAEKDSSTGASRENDRYSPQRALELYKLGADFVFIPRIHSSAQVTEIIELGLVHGLDQVREEQMTKLKARDGGA